MRLAEGQVFCEQGMETLAEIYVRLLGEGVDAYRPVPAKYVDGFLFEVLKPGDYDPANEIWEFPPGSMVRCEKRRLSPGKCFGSCGAPKLINHINIWATKRTAPGLDPSSLGKPLRRSTPRRRKIRLHSMRTYTAVIERCPDTGLYVGYVPGFPGAHSQGKMLDELNQNLREVIAMLLEDGQAPV